MKANIGLTAEILAQSDKDLYETILQFGVKPDTKLIVRWFLYSNNNKKANSIKNILNKIFPGVRYFSNYSIKIEPASGKKYPIVITTHDFHFTIQNVILFSRSLLELANKNGCEYDFWEIEIDCSKTNSK